MVEAHIHCRVAAPCDAERILVVLAEAAPEIPLLIDTNERWRSRLQNYRQVHRDGQVVGGD